ncbi:MAG TPA: DUF4328 domain-containing protein [Gemmatimonadales bacterium]|jgi:hypothetical protein
METLGPPAPTDPVQSQRSRARWVVSLLAACLVLDVLGMGSGLAQRALLLRVIAGEALSTEDASANDTRHTAIGQLQFLGFVVTALAWLFWLYRSYANLRLVGTRESRFTPGWAIGYWFIPLVNLVRPYQIVADLWWRSDGLNREGTTARRNTPAIISLWWGSYLLSGMVGRVAMTMARNAESLDQLRNLTDVGIAVDALSAIAAWCAIKVVRGIDKRQQGFPSIDQPPVGS